MKERTASFFYLNENHVPNYRKKVIEYLKENEYKFKNIGEPHVVVELHDFGRKENPDPSGHLYLHELEQDSVRFDEVCKYTLSKDRRFIPVSVICKDRKNYGLIKKILKENYGEKGKLTNGLLGLGAIFNIKTIKRA